jgi:hypothetical protein
MKQMRDSFGTTFIFSTHDTRIVGEAEIVRRLEDGRLQDLEKVKQYVQPGEDRSAQLASL